MWKWSVTASLLAFASSEPAHACRIYAGIDLNDVSYADVVVVGRISNYRIVRDEDTRRKMLSIPSLSAEMRKTYEDPSEILLWDYARFDVLVSEVLTGTAPKKLSVTWDNSTFGEPEKMPSGPFLIALRNPSSKSPPLRGPSATIFPNREPKSLTVLQAPCASAFIFEETSSEAQAVRGIVNARKR
jgi:hypothetical protein